MPFSTTLGVVEKDGWVQFFRPLNRGGGKEPGRKGFSGCRDRSLCTADARFRLLPRPIQNRHRLSASLFHIRTRYSRVIPCLSGTGSVTGARWGFAQRSRDPACACPAVPFSTKRRKAVRFSFPIVAKVLVRPSDRFRPTGACSGTPRPYPICLKKLS